MSERLKALEEAARVADRHRAKCEAEARHQLENSAARKSYASGAYQAMQIAKEIRALKKEPSP